MFKRQYRGPMHLNIIGDLYSESGLGNTARAIIHSIDGKISYTLINLPMSAQSRQQGQVNTKESHLGLEKGINIFIGNPDMLLLAFRKLNLVKLIQNYNVGIWFWELENIPSQWIQANKVMDEIWAQSDFVKQAFLETGKKATVMPFSLALLKPSKKTKQQFGLPEQSYLFLFTFDFLSHANRKNPEAVIDAFKSAFKPTDNVVLVFKTVNGSIRKAAFTQLKNKIGDDSYVVLMDEYMDSADVARLIELADCFVSLHRSEGLGLGMAEAMKLGTLAIATKYSGNLEYMNEDNSLLVNCKVVKVPKFDYPYSNENTWADPLIEDAILKIKLAVNDVKLRERLIDRAKVDISQYNANKQWHWIEQRLENIQ